MSGNILHFPPRLRLLTRQPFPVNNDVMLEVLFKLNEARQTLAHVAFEGNVREVIQIDRVQWLIDGAAKALMDNRLENRE